MARRTISFARWYAQVAIRKGEKSMKGKLSNIQNTTSISFDFELSETPKAMILRLLSSEQKEAMIGIFGGEDSYNDIKAEGDFDPKSSIGCIVSGEVFPLTWESPLQVQIGEQIKALKADGKEVPFVAEIEKTAGLFT